LGIPFWFGDLIWTVNVSSSVPDASRDSPGSPVTVYEGDTQAFTVLGTDPGGDLTTAEWFLDSLYQGWFPVLSGSSDTHTWSHTFDTSGTYQVRARVSDIHGFGDIVTWTVNVIVKQTQTLTIYSAAGGSVTTPGEWVFEYDEGTEVTLEATPYEGYHFTHWSGSVSSTSNPLYLTMDRDYDVTANFALSARAIYVDDDGPGDPGPGNPAVSDPQEDGTAEHPFDRIQEGIDAAAEGDSVIVLSGTYFETIDLRGLGIRLYSTDGPEMTTIDGTGAFHVVHCLSGEGPDTVIEGFTITGGNASGPPPDDWGGGMYNVNSSPTVNNCIFTGNAATLGGAGMCNVNSSPVMTNCLFNGNATAAGGMGAGMLNYGACRPVLTNCTFAGNAATSGNALACDSVAQSNPSTVMITNCILWDGGDEIISYDNSIVTVTYSDVQGGWPGTGNLSINPVFVSPPDGNLRLWTGSPCIDAGDGTVDTPPAWQPTNGAIVGALKFDGVDDFVVSHTIAVQLNGSNALTVALWVKSDVTNTDRGFIHFEEPHGTDDRGMRYDEWGLDGQGANLIKIGVICSARSVRQQLESSSNVQTTAWQHLVMTWSSGQPLKLYINGTLDTPTFNDPGLAGVLRGYTRLLIGRGGKYGAPSTDATTGWDGLIDDVAIFSRALDADEVVRLRNQGGASFVGDAHLETLWELDESTGPVARDSSGNGRDGWLACLPATDLDGKPRIVDGNNDDIDVVDMGAYEYEWEDTSRRQPRT
jgi:hypothetical protein